MADPVLAQLRKAVRRSDAVALEAALAAGADPDSVTDTKHDFTALHAVCWTGNLACARALLAAGADPNTANEYGATPLHMASCKGHTQCIRALLAAGASPTAVNNWGWSPLLSAVAPGRVEAATTLLKAAPELALLRDGCGRLPLQVALEEHRFATARCLLEHGVPPPAGTVLALFKRARRLSWWEEKVLTEAVLPLYAPLVARQPLTPAEWACVPNPCPGLGALLPAVLARSEAEAAQLVARLPAADRERLRTAALCIKRVERRRRASLPAELLRPLLLAAVE